MPTAVWILLGLALLVYLFLRARLRVSGWVTPEGHYLRVAWGPVSLRVLPAKPKKPKKAKKAKKKRPKKEKPEETETPPKKERRFSAAMLPPLLKAGRRALGRLLGGIRVKHLYSHIVAASPDAAKTALMFGAIHAGLGVVGPALARRTDDFDVTVGMDYSRSAPQFYLSAALSIRTGTLIAAVLSLAVALFRVLKAAPGGKPKEKTPEEERPARSA
jgi:hypothetical protein